MAENYVITPEQSRLPCYLRAIRQECLGAVPIEMLDRYPLSHPEIAAYKASLLGGRNDGTNYAGWTNFLLEEYGRMDRCLSLGSGSGRVEKHLIEIGFANRFESIDLSHAYNKIARNAEANFHAKQGDLNFCQFPKQEYDFVLCHGILHHLINLEHVLSQINDTLKRDGILLIHEYVGENRWQFTERRLNLLAEMFPSIKLKNLPIWSVDGFESIRSADLLNLIEMQFGATCERSVSYGSVLFPLVSCNWRDAREQLSSIIEADRRVSKQLTLQPCDHIGVYRKNDVPATHAVPWTDSELIARLDPWIPPTQRPVQLLNKLRLKVRFRSRLRLYYERFKVLFRRQTRRK
jgi:SAM-dependent methyltransferase